MEDVPLTTRGDKCCFKLNLWVIKSLPDDVRLQELPVKHRLVLKLPQMDENKEYRCYQKINTRLSVYFIILMCAVSFFSIWSSHYLFIEGARIFNSIYANGQLKIDHYRPYFFTLRFFNILLQIPSYLYMEYFSPVNTSLAKIIFSLPYNIIHIVSFIYCFYLLRRTPYLNYLIFPISSYLLSFMPSQYIMLSYAQDIHPLFWPIVFLTFRTGRPYRLIQIILIISMSITYESSMLILFTLGVFFLFKKKEIGQFPSVLSLSLSIFIFIYINYIAPELKSHIELKKILSFVISIKSIYIHLSLLIFCGITLLLYSFRLSFKKAIVLCTPPILIYIIFYAVWGDIKTLTSSVHTPFNYKIFLAPSLCTIFLVFVIVSRTGKKIRPDLYCFQIVALVVLSFSNMNEWFNVVLAHRRGVDNFSTYYNLSKDCTYINRDDFYKYLERYGIPGTSTHEYSIASTKNRVLDRLLFSDMHNWMTGKLNINNPCKSKKLKKRRILIKDIFINIDFHFNPDDYKKLKFDD